MVLKKRPLRIFFVSVLCLAICLMPLNVYADGPTPRVSYAIFTNNSVIPVENTTIYATSPSQNVDGIPLPVMWTNSGYNVALHGSMDVDTWDWSVGGAPAGMTFNEETGTLSGRPSTAQSGYMVINPVNENGTGRTMWLDYVVLDISMKPTITTNYSLPDAYIGQPINQHFELDGYLGASRTWSLESGTIPAGTAISAFATDGVLSGTPTESGTFRFTVAMENRAGKVTKEFTLRVRPGLENVEITTAGIPSGVVGEEYTAALHASGTTPITWSVDSRSTLPDGLSLNSETGVLSGTPSAAGYHPFVIKAQNSLGRANSSDSVYYAFEAYERPVITMDDSFDYINGDDVFIPFRNTGSSGSWSITAGNLPSGLYLSGDGIYGTALQSGTFPVTLRLSVASGVYDMKQITIEVVDTYGFSVSQTTSHTFPGQTAGYSDDDIIRNRLTVSISNTGTAPTGDFSVYATGADAASFYIDRTSITSLQPNASYSFKVYPQRNLGVGRYTATVNIEESTSHTVESFDVSFSVVEAAVRPTIVTENVGIVNDHLRGGMVGEPWSYQLYAEGTEPITWELDYGELPPGIVLNASTGLLSGIPTEAFHGSAYIIARNVAGQSDNRIDLNIDIYDPLAIYTTQNDWYGEPGATGYDAEELPDAFVYSRYIDEEIYVSANNDREPTFEVIGNAPSFVRNYGDSVDIYSGLIEPSMVGTYRFTLRATLKDTLGNVLDTADRPMMLTVYPRMTSTATNSNSIVIPDQIAGIAMPEWNVSGAVSGGKAPYSFAVADGESLPAGISLSSAGVLSGTPTEAGSSQVKFIATDAAGNTADVYIEMTIGLDGFTVDVPDGTEFIDTLTITVTNGASPDMYFTYLTTRYIQGATPQPTDTRVPADGKIIITDSCAVYIRGFQEGTSGATDEFQAYYERVERPEAPEIDWSPNENPFTDLLTVSLYPPYDPPGLELYYTTDGSEPAPADELSPSAQYYTGPFTITEMTTVKAVAFDPEHGVFSSIAEELFTKVLLPDPAVVSGTASVAKGGNQIDLSANVSGALGDVSYEIVGDDLGCSLDSYGGFTSGDTAGTVTVRVTVGESTNYAGKTADIVVTVNGLLDVRFNHSCTFGNNLSINYYIPQSYLEGYSDYRLHLEKKRFNATGDSFEWVSYDMTNYSNETVSGTPMICFRFRNIASYEIGNDINATLYATKADVTYVSDVDVYSAKQYAYNRLIKSSDAVFKTLLVDMLNYGANAQSYFNYNTGNPVNAELTAEQIVMGTVADPVLVSTENTTETPGATAHWYGKSVVFSSNMELKYYMTFDSGAPADTVKLKLTYTSATGTNHNVEIPGTAFQYESSYNAYSAKLTTIAAMDTGAVVTAGIYDGETLISDVLDYSIETYCYNRLNKSSDESFKSLLRAVMKYAKSAEAYFRN